MICLTVKYEWLLEQETSKPNRSVNRGGTRYKPYEIQVSYDTFSFWILSWKELKVCDSAT